MCLRSIRALFLLAAIAVSASSPVSAQSAPPHSAPADWGPISINLEEYEYPYPVEYMNFSVYGKDVRIAYMDVPLFSIMAVTTTAGTGPTRLEH